MENIGRIAGGVFVGVLVLIYAVGNAFLLYKHHPLIGCCCKPHDVLKSATKMVGRVTGNATQLQPPDAANIINWGAQKSQ